MDKIRKILSPGSTKDDEVMYGNEQATLAESSHTQSKRDTPVLQEQEHDISRPILHSDDKKYNETAYGTTTTTAGVFPSSTNKSIHAPHDDNTVGADLTGAAIGGHAVGGSAAHANASEGITPITSSISQSAHPIHDQHSTAASTVPVAGIAPISSSTTSSALPIHEAPTVAPTINTTPANLPISALPIAEHYSTTGSVLHQSTLQSGRPAESHVSRDAGIIATTGVVGAGGYQSGNHHSAVTPSTLDSLPQTDALLHGQTSNQSVQEHSGGRDAVMPSIVPVTASRLEPGSGLNANPISSQDHAFFTTTAVTAGVGKPGMSGSSHNRMDSAHIPAAGVFDAISKEPHSHAEVPQGSGIGPDNVIAGGLVANKLNSSSTHGSIPHDNTIMGRDYYMGKPGETVHDIPHVPGEFPTQTGEDIHSPAMITSTRQQPAIIAAATAMKSHGEGTGHSSPSGITANAAPLTQRTPLHADNDHTGRNTAVGGGVLGASTVGAVAAYEAAQARNTTVESSSRLPQATDFASTPTAPVSALEATHAPPTIQSSMNHPPVHRTTATDTLRMDAMHQQVPSHTEGSRAEPSSVPRDSMTAGGAAVLGTGGISAAKHDRDLVDTTHVPIHTEQHDRDTLSENKHLPTPMEERQPEPTHLGRETAIIGGVGVLGAGGVYAATHDRDPLADTTRDAYGVEDPNKHNKLHKPTPDEKKLEKDHEKEAKEAQKQHEKEEKERQKAFEKAEKERVKEAEKAEKERIKEAEKAEKKHEKEIEKAEKKHHKEEEKAETKHDGHHEKEKKPSLIDRILHPGRHSDDKERTDDKPEVERRSIDNEYTKNYLTPPPPTTAHGTTDAPGGHPQVLPPRTDAKTTSVIDPHTGLPMDLSKGTGRGGTDASPTILGYHEIDPAVMHASVGTGQGAGTNQGHAQPGEAGVAGPDWDAIKKANTPY